MIGLSLDRLKVQGSVEDSMFLVGLPQPGCQLRLCPAPILSDLED